MDWTVKGSNPVKSWRFSLSQNVQTGLLFHGYRGSFPGVQRPGCKVDHSPSSSAEVKKCGGTRLLVLALCPFVGWTGIPLHLRFCRVDAFC